MANNNQNNQQGGNNGGNDERGFKKMQREDPERLSEIASEGGKTAHERGGAHEWNSEEAREAGRKGGQARAENRQNEMEGEV